MTILSYPKNYWMHIKFYLNLKINLLFIIMTEKRLWSAKATGRKCTKLSTENESPYTDFLHHNDNVLRIPTDSRFKQAVTLSSPSRTNRIPIVCINLGYKWSFKITGECKRNILCTLYFRFHTANAHIYE